MQQFGGQFDTGGASADDGHADAARPGFTGMCLHVTAQQLAMEAFGLLAGIQENAVLGGPGGSEIVGRAADRYHQGVVIQRTRGHELHAELVACGFQADALVRTVQAGHAAHLELEVIPLGLRHIVELVG